MYRILTTQELNRLGFTHEDIRFARTCCLLRLSRGVYVARRVCTVERHRPLWAGIAERTHDELVEHGDNRDAINELSAKVMARRELQFQRRNARTASANESGDSGAVGSGDSGAEETTDHGNREAQSGVDVEVVSHISAALVHGLPVAYPVTHQVEVVRPGVNRRYPSLHVRGTTIPAAHCQRVGGMRVTTLERTLVDVARTYSLEISVAMIDDALRRSLTTLERIRAVVAQAVEKRNTKRVERALDLADGRRESPGESIAAVRFYQHGIVGMVPQVTFRTERQRPDIRVDFCHKGARLIVEIDGIGKLYLGSGVPREELEKERRREQWLRERGWRLIRISWKELFEEAKFNEIKHAVMVSASTASAG